MTDEELDAIEQSATRTDEWALPSERRAQILLLVAEVRRLRAEPPLQISLAEGQSYVTPTGWRLTMRDGTMVIDHEKVRFSCEYWNDAEQRWQGEPVVNGTNR